MAKITNLYGSRIALPDGTEIDAGETAEVENWDKLKDHAVVSVWLSAGVIDAELSDAEADAAKKAQAEAEAQAKAEADAAKKASKDS